MIGEVIADLKEELSRLGIDYEIIVVNDGCVDGCRQILNNLLGITLINHPYNKGYGASLKTGAQKAKYEWLLFFDGDGQHRVEHIKDLIKYADEYEMVVGARTGYQGPWIRQPGKWFLKRLASYLVDFKIPDLNSGLRLVKKDSFNRFVHLYPNGFSLSTTITTAFLKEGLNVKYVPIEINRRVGKSTVRPRHAAQALVLIIRMITLFAPMRFFFPISFLLLFLTAVSLVHDIVTFNLGDTTAILFISTIIIFLFGIVLDQLAAIRRGGRIV